MNWKTQIRACSIALVLTTAVHQGAGAQVLQEGQWVGRIIHLTGRYMDTVNHVSYDGGQLRISMEVNRYGPFEFEQIRLTQDSLSFVWSPSFELSCTLSLLPDGVYQGACMDPWGGFGGIVLGPPGTDVDAVALDEQTIESIAGWIDPEEPEPDLSPQYPAGETALVAGTSMNYVVAGQGPVTVVLESGLGDNLATWESLHKRLSRTLRVVAYDRAGLGQSEQNVYSRSPEQMATELRGLLREAGIPGPYVLVAHAESAFAARRFAALYEDDVRALVLIDPHHEGMADLWESMDEKSWRRFWQQKKEFFSRLPGMVSSEFSVYADIIESGGLPGLTPVPSQPTYVLTSGRSRLEATWVGESQQGRDAWTSMHARWVEGMPDGQHLAFTASGPNIHHEDPDGVARVIEALASNR